MNEGGNSGVEVPTMRGRDYPTVRQFTVFLENRVGQLLDIVRRFEGSEIRVAALSITYSGDCAFARFVLSDPERGREILERAGLAIVETDLLAVELPTGTQPLLQITAALIEAEINIIQAYPLLIRPHGQAAVAIMTDNIERSQETLVGKGLRLLTEGDINDESEEV